jgi:hypothetical protein
MAGKLFQLHNDEPVLVDQLGRKQLVEEMGDVIACCHPPHVFGVHGDWGLGKTSLLHQLHYHLAGECPQQSKTQLDQMPAGENVDNVKAVIWFEAWRYQNEPAPIVALLHEMRSQLEWHVKLVDQTRKKFAVAIRGALLSLEDLTKKIGFQASKIEQAGREWEQQHLAETLPSNTVRQQLEEAIYGLIAPGVAKEKRRDQRLVVLIDDLDRCEGDAAYRLLEGLKIYLTLPNCVFVLGMNEQVVEDAIANHCPRGGDGRQRAQAYLEKLCQNVWRLPSVSDPKKYFLDLIPHTMVRDYVEKALNIEAPCLPPNPRRIKGLANLVQRLAASVLSPTDSEDDQNVLRKTQMLLIVASVYQFHDELYRLWESEPLVFKHLLDWARGNPLELTAAETEQEKRAEEGLPFFRLLGQLRRPCVIRRRSDDTYEVRTAFPDPTDSCVLWVQSLMHHVAWEFEKLGAPLDPDSFLELFHRVKEI